MSECDCDDDVERKSISLHVTVHGICVDYISAVNFSGRVKHYRVFCNFCLYVFGFYIGCTVHPW